MRGGLDFLRRDMLYIVNDRSFKEKYVMPQDAPQNTAQNTRSDAPRNRAKQMAQRRDQILTAAMMCFLENGYHQTGVRDIAKRAGVSLGNLYNHFPSKHDVLSEIAQLERDEMAPFLSILAKPGDATKGLAKFLKAYAKYLAAPENVILSVEITAEAIRKPDIAALFLGNRDIMVASLAALLERGAQEGNFRATPSSRDTAHMILELVEAGAYRSVLGDVRMRKITPNLFEFVMAGLRK